MDWLARAEAEPKIDKALDIVFDAIDEMLLAGRFAEVDADLGRIDVRATSTDLLVGILTITFMARRELPSRAGFFELVRQELESRGENDPRTLHGLDRE